MSVRAENIEGLVEDGVNDEAVFVFMKGMACRALTDNHRAIVGGDVDNVDTSELAKGFHGFVAISPESAPNVRWVLRCQEENSQAGVPMAHVLTRRPETTPAQPEQTSSAEPSHADLKRDGVLVSVRSVDKLTQLMWTSASADMSLVAHGCHGAVHGELEGTRRVSSE